MKAAIDTGKKRLGVKQLFRRTISAPWASITQITLTRFPSLGDEIGMVARAGEYEFHLHETDKGFWEFLKALDIESQLPASWYADVETGNVFTIKVNRPHSC